MKFSLTESYTQKRLPGFWTGVSGRGPVTQSGANFGSFDLIHGLHGPAELSFIAGLFK